MASTAALGHEDLVVLVVSDVHHAMDNCAKLHDWLQQNPRKVDVVLNAGDSANLPSGEGDNPLEVAKAAAELSDVLNALERTFPSQPLYFIGGNHDPGECMLSDDPPRYSPASTNVHRRVVPLRDGLLLAGFGGSCDAFRDGAIKWAGYPFNDEQIGNGVEELLNSLETRDHQVLLMTHVGPNDSPTTIDLVLGGGVPIYSGSKRLNQVLLESRWQQQVLLNVHGHTHTSPGMHRFAEIDVANPGPLRERKFAIFTFKYHEPLKQWYIAASEFHRLER